jgi:hypothetical protein
MSCSTVVDILTSTPMLHAEGYANAGRRIDPPGASFPPEASSPAAVARAPLDGQVLAVGHRPPTNLISLECVARPTILCLADRPYGEMIQGLVKSYQISRWTISELANFD